MGLTSSSVSISTHQLTRLDGKLFKVKRYSPPTTASPCGLLLISPGAGGSENGLNYIAEYFSSNGWLAYVMEHIESNFTVLRELVKQRGLRQGLVDLVTDPISFQGRMMDIQEVLRAVGTTVQGPKILLGHSMGAATVMIESGAGNKLQCQGEDRFDAYIALSPQGPGIIFPVNAWRNLGKPMLLITGTEDKELETGDWRNRLKPFDNMKPGTHKWLGVIDGATHMNLGGRGFSRSTKHSVVMLIDLFIQKSILGKLEDGEAVTTRYCKVDLKIK